MNKVGGIWMLLLMILSGSALHAQNDTLAGAVECGAADTSGIWVVPCHVTAITVDVYGGGAGGGGGGGGSNGGFNETVGGGGGGGGGYSTITISVIPGSTFSYSIGSGGCGGENGDDQSDGNDGEGGGACSFSGIDGAGVAIDLLASGGAGGRGGDVGTFSSGTPGSGGDGGSSTGGITDLTGSSGSDGIGGSGGFGGAGAGPDGGMGGLLNGGNGFVYGGGGAGGGNSNGGNGASGSILITYVTQAPSIPTIVGTAATCSADGTATIGNYDSTWTYTFVPTGPTVGAGGVISGMTFATSYTVYSSIGGCSSTSSQPFGIEEQLPAPQILPSGNQTVCVGENIILDTGSGYDTYLWSNDSTTQTIEVTMSGIYHATVTFDGCMAGSDTVEVIVITVQPTVTATGNVLSVPDGYVSYQWYQDGGPISGATDSIYTAVESGIYQVEVTDVNGCVGFSFEFDYTLPIGIKEQDVQLPFIIYPNPSNGRFQLEMSVSGSYTVQIFNSLGRSVMSTSAARNEKLDIQLEVVGAYLLRVQVKGRWFTKKLVVQ